MHRKGRYRVGSLPLIIQCSYYHPTKKRRGFKFSCVKPWFVGSMEAKQNRMSPRCKHTAVVVFQRLPKWDWIFFKKKVRLDTLIRWTNALTRMSVFQPSFIPYYLPIFFYLQAGSPRLAADWQWPALTWKRKKLGTSRRVEALLFRAAVQFRNWLEF